MKTKLMQYASIGAIALAATLSAAVPAQAEVSKAIPAQADIDDEGEERGFGLSGILQSIFGG